MHVAERVPNENGSSITDVEPVSGILDGDLDNNAGDELAGLSARRCSLVGLAETFRPVQSAVLAAYPLVPHAEVGFRIQVTAANTDEQIAHLCRVLTELDERFPLQRHTAESVLDPQWLR